MILQQCQNQRKKITKHDSTNNETKEQIIRTSFQTLNKTPTNQWNGIKVKTLIMKALDGDPKNNLLLI
jgi:hypothetical protein